MKKYNYLEEVKNDVINYISEEGITVTSDNRNEVAERLNEELFACDAVTGNASGSYTFNRYTAMPYLSHNLDILQDACEELGIMPPIDNAEACDVMIKCYLLPDAINLALDEVEE